MISSAHWADMAPEEDELHFYFDQCINAECIRRALICFATYVAFKKFFEIFINEYNLENNKLNWMKDWRHFKSIWIPQYLSNRNAYQAKHTHGADFCNED